MANAVYPSAKKLIWDGDLDLLNDDIRIILVDLADYAYSAAHDFLDDVPAAARVAVSGALTGKTTTSGIFDSDDAALGNVTGDQSEGLVFYKHTGVEGTSPLIIFLDTGQTGLPVTPSGGPITLKPHATNGWFRITP